MVGFVMAIVAGGSDGGGGGGRWIRGEVGAERRQLIAGAYGTPAEVKIKRHEARPFGGTMVESH